MNEPHNLSAAVSMGDVDLVRDLLANARENGHPMDGENIHQIAHDMNRCASDVEGWSHEYLVAVLRHALSNA